MDAISLRLGAIMDRAKPEVIVCGCYQSIVDHNLVEPEFINGYLDRITRAFMLHNHRNASMVNPIVEDIKANLSTMTQQEIKDKFNAIVRLL